MHEVRLKLTARTKALWEQMRAALETECDGHLEDDQLAEVVTRRVLGGDGSPTGKVPRPAHRIVVHKCGDCARAWQESRGRWIELGEADLALAECDAVIVDETDPATSSMDVETSAPERTSQVTSSADAEMYAPSTRANPTTDEPAETDAPAASKSGKITSDIPARTRRRVWARDQGRCRVPGCRATRHIDIHHLIPRALGGTHDEWSLCLLCSGHHQQHHQGLLSITGRAPDQQVFIRDGKRLVDARCGAEASGVDALRSSTAAPIATSRFADVCKLEHAKQALRQLGFTARAARGALELASAHVDADADVPQLVRAALQLSRHDAPAGMASAPHDAVGKDELTKMATLALVQLGYPRPVAVHAVSAASAHVGAEDLETLIEEALQRTRS
jgi:Holliday junction resolvasome RuvABC DNA-binding subunit/5-methylcytosine-specific restriction endonuclease McrA